MPIVIDAIIDDSETTPYMLNEEGFLILNLLFPIGFIPKTKPRNPYNFIFKRHMLHVLKKIAENPTNQAAVVVTHANISPSPNHRNFATYHGFKSNENTRNDWSQDKNIDENRLESLKNLKKAIIAAQSHLMIGHERDDKKIGLGFSRTHSSQVLEKPTVPLTNKSFAHAFDEEYPIHKELLQKTHIIADENSPAELRLRKISEKQNTKKTPENTPENTPKNTPND